MTVPAREAPPEPLQATYFCITLPYADLFFAFLSTAVVTGGRDLVGAWVLVGFSGSMGFSGF
jgi:hypothetical protein